MNYHPSILQVASIIKNKDQIKAQEKKKYEKQKRDRTANYNKNETNKLVDLLLLKKDVFGNKKNNSDSWTEKREAWEQIEKEFNSKLEPGEVYRDSKCLRTKYDSLKRDIKRKWNTYLSKKQNSKRSMPHFSTAEKKMKELMSLPMEGLCDFNALEDENPNKNDDSDEPTTESSACSSDSDVEKYDVKKEVTADRGSSDLQVEKIKMPVKKEVEVPDEACHINFELPPTKIMRLDPLVETDRVQNTLNETIDNEKTKNELQIEILREELAIKKLQKKMLEEEFEHKKLIHELEKEHLLSKINQTNK